LGKTDWGWAEDVNDQSIELKPSLPQTAKIGNSEDGYCDRSPG
jgi:hypothetical protein